MPAPQLSQRLSPEYEWHPGGYRPKPEVEAPPPPKRELPSGLPISMLKWARQQLGMSLAEFAKAISPPYHRWSTGYLSRVENGQRSVSPDLLEDLEAFFASLS